MIQEVHFINLLSPEEWLIKVGLFSFIPFAIRQGGEKSVMTINNEKAFMDGVWDWGMLDSCFSRGIKVSDIDGFVERKGRFLVLETKKPGVTIPKGQEIAFKNMQRTGLFTVMVVWGTKNYPTEMQVYYPNGQISKKKPADMNKFKELVAWWFQSVDKASQQEEAI